MRQCLTHPKLGYYTSRDPLGSQGDFITSPEISQMFGEMIGVWLFSTWMIQGKPSKVNFIEFGPGKGTLMLDVMTSFSRLVNKREQLGSVETGIVMVEASHVLRQKQASKIGGSDVDATGEFWKGQHRWTGPLTWVDTEKDVYKVTDEDDTNFIIAHEFFDALPINKFQKTKEGWREILVDQHPETGEFCLVQASKDSPACSIPRSQHRYDSAPLGTVVEISPETYSYSKVMSDLITQNGKSTGALLIVDYGPKDEVPGNTLRGIKDHKIVSPFVEPGDVDLSADVDFQAIAHASSAHSEVDILGPVEQGDFLTSMGIQTRANQLIKRAKTQHEKDAIIAACKRLVEKDDSSMGGIYKFMGVVPKGVHVPVGFTS
jgi:SAM-dependent MidA family methyltransferase